MTKKTPKFFEAKATGEDVQRNNDVGKLLQEENDKDLSTVKLLMLGKSS